MNIADFARFEVSTVATMTITLFWDVASRSLLRVSLTEICFLHLQEKSKLDIENMVKKGKVITVRGRERP
jgi:hypothetical protein